MICYRCNGTGEYDIYNECPVCDGTGEIEITNEEWFTFLSTEEKAKAIVCLAHNASALAIEHHCSDVEVVCVWLQEVHHD